MSEQRKPGLRKSMFVAGISLVLLIILLLAYKTLFIQGTTNNQQSSQIENMNKTDLETEKLRQEVKQLLFENEKLTNPWEGIPTYATFITAIVAVAGVFLTVWKQFSERQSDREQRDAESRRLLDGKFSSIVTDIGSANRSLQVSAIVSLMTFLRPEYFDFHEQAYLILLANLKIESSSQVNRLLIQAFERALILKLNTPRNPTNPLELDFAHTNLYHVNLSGLDLSNADLGFANLHSANLISSNLFRAKGIEVNLEKAKLTGANLNEARFSKANLANAHLHDANLVAANLKGANLNGTEFFKARLQSAHLEDANIFEAHFEQANLQDTYFNGAKLNLTTLRSIGKAYNWENAHFDEDVKAKIIDLVGEPNN